MTINLLVLQHAEWERPGRLLVESAREHGADLRVVEIFRETVPDPAGYDGLLLLGGPPNVHEEDRYPFLREEKRLIRAWLSMDRPCLGFCLGHQLLADALGAGIHTNFMPSIGFIPGLLTHHGREHPLFAGIDRGLELFKWHGQSIQTPLPRELVLLATSSQCVVEGFSVTGRPHIIGLQCDNHAAHPDDVASWCAHDRQWLNGLGLNDGARARLVEQARDLLPVMRATFATLAGNFLKIVTEHREAR